MIRNPRGNPRLKDARMVRSRATRARDVAAIGEMWARGKTGPEILAHLNTTRPYRISLTQLYTDLSESKRAWLEKLQQPREKLIADELSKLNLVETEAIKGWLRAVYGTDRPDDDTKPEKFSIIPLEEARARRVSAADAMKFLSIIANVSHQRCRLLGLNSPTKILSARVDTNRLKEMSRTLCLEKGLDPDLHADDIARDAELILGQLEQRE
jgi:hypothetical protein